MPCIGVTLKSVFSGAVGWRLDAGGVTVSVGEDGGVCTGGACGKEVSCPGVSTPVDESVPGVSGLETSEDAGSDEVLFCVSSGLDGCSAEGAVDGVSAGVLSVWVDTSAAKTDVGAEASSSAADIYKISFAVILPVIRF